MRRCTGSWSEIGNCTAARQHLCIPDSQSLQVHNGTWPLYGEGVALGARAKMVGYRVTDVTRILGRSQTLCALGP